MTKQTSTTAVEDKDKLSVPLDDWRERFDEKFKHNLWSDADSLAVDMNEKIKAFIAAELDRREEEVDERWIYHPAKTIDARIRADERKAYGGCEKCYGKGYHTELTSQTVSADFAGDKSSRTTISNANPCSCERGKQFAQVIEMTRQNERQRVISLLVDEDNRHKGHDVEAHFCSNASCCLSLNTNELPDFIEGRNQLRAELRTKIEQMGDK